MDYGAKAGDYVEAFMRVIHWTNPNILFAQYS
jgi:superoxide dismutase